MKPDSEKLKQDKWNKHYAGLDSAEIISPPAYVLEHYSYLLPLHGRALDLACGLAGNALFMAQRGLQTHAWDSSDSALRRVADMTKQHSLTVTLSCRDVELESLEQDAFDVIVVSRFLWRPLCAAIMSALRPNGLLFYQTFIVDKAQNVGPTSPTYLLQKNELLQLFSGLTVLVYQELGTVGNITQGFRNEAFLVAQKK